MSQKMKRRKVKSSKFGSCCVFSVILTGFCTLHEPQVTKKIHPFQEYYSIIVKDLTRIVH